MLLAPHYMYWEEEAGTNCVITQKEVNKKIGSYDWCKKQVNPGINCESTA